MLSLWFPSSLPSSSSIGASSSNTGTGSTTSGSITSLARTLSRAKLVDKDSLLSPATVHATITQTDTAHCGCRLNTNEYRCLHPMKRCALGISADLRTSFVRNMPGIGRDLLWKCLGVHPSPRSSRPCSLSSTNFYTQKTSVCPILLSRALKALLNSRTPSRCSASQSRTCACPPGARRASPSASWRSRSPPSPGARR